MGSMFWGMEKPPSISEQQ